MTMGRAAEDWSELGGFEDYLRGMGRAKKDWRRFGRAEEGWGGLQGAGEFRLGLEELRTIGNG